MPIPPPSSGRPELLPPSTATVLDRILPVSLPVVEMASLESTHPATAVPPSSAVSGLDSTTETVMMMFIKVMT